MPSYEHKAFIPYTAVFSAAPNSSQHIVVKARVLSTQSTHVTLDREWQGTKAIPFDYLVAATGTRLPAPGSMESDEKLPSVEYFKQYQAGINKAQSVVIVGGGAVGVQMACDLKEVYPDKVVTLIHSRDQLMPVYHENLSKIIKERFAELDVKYAAQLELISWQLLTGAIRLIAGTRVIVPANGFPNSGKPFEVELKDGRKVMTELAILATGQTPNNAFLSGLRSSSPDSIINPTNGFIRVRPTLQFKDPLYPHLYAVGDIADSGAHKAARPGAGQAAVAAKNILAMMEGKEPVENIEIGPAGIHMTLGLVS